MILIDFSNVALANVFALSREFSLAEDQKQFTKIFRHALLQTILSYKTKFGKVYGTDIVIAADGKGNWRKQEFPEYKASRAKARDQSGLNWDYVFAAMDTMKEEIRTLYPWPIIELPELEGDDVIAILVKRPAVASDAVTDFFAPAGDSGPAQRTLIISADGDMKQLHSKQVQQWSPMTRDFVSIKDGWTIYEKIAKGDSGDGVPNIYSDDDWFTKPQSSRAKAVSKKLISEVHQAITSGTVDKVFPADVARRIRRNINMVDMNHIPKRFHAPVLESLDKYEPKGSKHLMMEHFMQLGASQLLARLDEF